MHGQEDFLTIIEKQEEHNLLTRHLEKFVLNRETELNTKNGVCPWIQHKQYNSIKFACMIDEISTQIQRGIWN